MLDNMKMSRPGLEYSGFCGFISVWNLRLSGCHEVPEKPGAYIVGMGFSEAPRFLNQGSGGHFKEKNPNVLIDVLEANWVPESYVLYIGKANNLHNRIKRYLESGTGKAVAHWGGRFIWQLADHEEFESVWLETPDPTLVERHLLKRFVGLYGCLPYANLRK